MFIGSSDFDEFINMDTLLNLLDYTHFSEINHRPDIFQFDVGDIVIKLQKPDYYDVNWFLNKLTLINIQQDSLFEDLAPILEFFIIKTTINLEYSRLDILFGNELLDKTTQNSIMAQLFYMIMFIIIKYTEASTEDLPIVSEIKKIKIDQKRERFDVYDVQFMNIVDNTVFFRSCPNEHSPC